MKGTDGEVCRTMKLYVYKGYSANSSMEPPLWSFASTWRLCSTVASLGSRENYFKKG